MSLLDRLEFRVLRRLSAEQLARIDPETAEPWKPDACPLAQATRRRIGNEDAAASALMLSEADSCAYTDIREEAAAFLDWFDDPDLSDYASLAAALAERRTELETEG